MPSLRSGSECKIDDDRNVDVKLSAFEGRTIKLFWHLIFNCHSTTVMEISLYFLVALTGAGM